MCKEKYSMPEGPEVRTITDVLNEKLQGSTLIEMYYVSTGKFANGIPGQKQVKTLFPATIEQVICKGKQIFFVFRSILTNESFYLNSTLGMEGRWTWTREKHSNFWMVIGVDVNTSTKYCLYKHKLNVYFDDSRHFGNLTLMTQNEYETKLTKIGPDLLAETITEQQWNDKIDSVIKRSRRPKQICEFLMNQDYFSGIGNYLKSEILYRARVLPNRTLNSLTMNERNDILRHSMETIRESYQSKGLTVRSYWDPNGNKGRFKRVVYQKEQDPLGNKVEKGQFLDKRMSFYVPALQH
jgi:formamidopyrimidine-DNA glycosylase